MSCMGCLDHRHPFWTVINTMSVGSDSRGQVAYVTYGQCSLILFLVSHSQMASYTTRLEISGCVNFFHLTSCWSILFPKAAFCNEHNLANEEVGNTSVWVMDHVLRNRHLHMSLSSERAKGGFILLFYFSLNDLSSWLSRFEGSLYAWVNTLFK